MIGLRLTRLSILRQALTLKDYAAGELYGLEKFWAFLKYRKSTKPLVILPELTELLQRFTDIGDFAVRAALLLHAWVPGCISLLYLPPVQSPAYVRAAEFVAYVVLFPPSPFSCYRRHLMTRTKSLSAPRTRLKTESVCVD